MKITFLVRASEKALIERTGKVGSILINERGDLKALPFGRIRAGATKDVLWQNPDFSIRYLASDSEKVKNQKSNFVADSFILADCDLRRLQTASYSRRYTRRRASFSWTQRHFDFSLAN